MLGVGSVAESFGLRRAILFGLLAATVGRVLYSLAPSLHHGLGVVFLILGALVVVAAILIVYATVSRPLDRRGVTSALFLMLAGLLVGPSVLGWLDVPLKGATAEHIAELSLALLLFSDAARIDLVSLRRHLAWPGRLLLIGLPLTMAAGALAGLAVFPGMAFASVALLSIMVSPTDAALGQRILSAGQSAPPIKPSQTNSPMKRKICQNRPRSRYSLP